MTTTNIPQYITNYIDYLGTLQSSKPTEFYARYGLTPTSGKSVSFVVVIDPTTGYIVQHVDQTNTLLLSEHVEPPEAIGSAPLPPINFDTTAPLTTPIYAAPAGYFALTVENKGLPAGYAATTTIKISTITGALVSVIDVPFKGRYELPLVDAQSGQVLHYDISKKVTTIKTTSGDYVSDNVNHGINPKVSEYYSSIIKWTKATSPTIAPSGLSVVTLTAQPPVTISNPTPVANSPVQPIVQLSTAPRSPMAIPPLSAMYNFIAIPDPANTFRADTVIQMFSFSLNSNQTNLIYNVGLPPDIQSVSMRFRNNTISNPLQLHFDNVPGFLRLNVPFTFTVTPLQEIIISVTFNEADAKLKSITKTRIFNEFLKWSVIPLNLTGPVLIQRNLPSLVS